MMKKKYVLSVFVLLSSIQASLNGLPISDKFLNKFFLISRLVGVPSSLYCGWLDGNADDKFNCTGNGRFTRVLGAHYFLTNPLLAVTCYYGSYFWEQHKKQNN